ncbi:hypothetical protein CYMTET_46304, partial [Cymbomonas tetramitiformis]
MAAKSFSIRTAGIYFQNVQPKFRKARGSYTMKSARLGARLQQSRRSCRVQCKTEIQEEEHAIDYYGILGVAADAEKSELKKAYREAVKLLHPDICDDAQTKEERHDLVITLNRAYRVLGDKRLRAMYDTGKKLFEEHSMFRDYTGQPLSKTAQPDALNALFVDETLCI